MNSNGLNGSALKSLYRAFSSAGEENLRHVTKASGQFGLAKQVRSCRCQLAGLACQGSVGCSDGRIFDRLSI